MKGSNPLFVDSTKFAGDGIRTQFEATRIMLHDGEKVFAKVLNRDGHPQLVPLHEQEPGIFSGSIYLRHQEEITYQFYIKNDDGLIYKSVEFKGRAAYMISERWAPVVAIEVDAPKKVEIPKKSASTEPLPEFEAQRKSLMNAVEALQNFFPETNP